MAEQLLDGAILRRRRTPLVMQTEAAECGMACIAMIAGHYGRRIDLAALRRYYNLSLKGMTLLDVVRVGSVLRLSTRGLRTEISDLRQMRLPCILHFDHNHFVVLTRASRRSATIHDPAVGTRKIAREELSRRFTGIVLEAWPTKEFERKTERARIRMLDLVRTTEGFTKAVTQILVMSLFLEIIVLTTPLAFQLVLDEVIVADDRDLLVLIALGLSLMLGFRVITDFIRSWAMMTLGASLSLQWKMSLYSHLLRLPLSFFERRHVGDLASRFMSLDVIQRTLTTGPISGLVDGLLSIGLIIMMWLYSPLLSVLAISVVTIDALLRAVIYRQYRAANNEAIVFGALENSHLFETLRGMPSIKALVIEDRRKTCWTKYLVDHIGADLRMQKLDLVFKTTNTLLFGLDRLLIIFFGASAVMSGSLTVGMLVAFLSYKDQLAQRISTMFDCVIKMSLLSLHGERIADIALADAEEERAMSLSFLLTESTSRPINSALSARGITFRYGDNEPPVLKNFDLEVAPGECVAIVGPSGGGKTTLLKILSGLLLPTSGEVLLDDIPIGAIGLEAYRSQIGCVLQDDRLFAGSIADNIAAFSPCPDGERIEHAAKLAAIHEEILRMPMGYETLVGDMGSSLSGGQVQRVVLARALYRAPRILLLDEATSHLDEENERAINEAVRRLPVTRVIVAHRRSTIEMADRIVPVWAIGATSARPRTSPLAKCT